MISSYPKNTINYPTNK